MTTNNKKKQSIAQNTVFDNVKHYIDSIKNGNSFFTLERKLHTISIVLALLNVLTAIAFYMTSLYVLMIFSIVSIFYYSILVQSLVTKGKYPSSMLAITGHIIIYSFLATFLTGTNTGFSLYDFILITAFFYLTFVIDSFQKKEFIPFVFSIMVCICFLFNYVAMMFMEPVYTLPQKWIDTFYICNSIFVFSSIIVFSFMLVWEIKLSNHRLASQNEQLDELAHKDPLTKLYNRRSMNKFLAESLDNLKLRGKRFSLILGDIDDFKKVNDTYGHDAGDLVLTTVASLITANVRNNDVVCRWGGEEILILINDPMETASMAAERIRKSIEEANITFEDQVIHVTMTFGLSESIPGFKIEHLIQQADDKLYSGKKAGKNRVVI